MTTYEKFYSEILPGNYALTKSMELTKINTSGTLWYMKKFLVLYYYVFLSNKLMTREYIKEVINSFDEFIYSLNPEVQEQAKKFFYPDNYSINFKSENFKSFSCFAAAVDFENQIARNDYYQNAKKMYFALLMGSGGQTGVKKKLKETIETSHFIYSKTNINSAIMNAVEEICVEQINSTGKLSDNSAKYIISYKAINEMEDLAKRETLTIEKVRAVIKNHNDHEMSYRNIENDMVAFIRNERQVMYYFGYFHSKSAGAADEFSSLTPIGEIALNANYYEFLAIWEHQKIKMISQPVTADINKIVTCSNSPSSFAISYTPYTDILGYIARNGELTIDGYKYIVSRRSHNISEDEWQKNETEIFEHLSEIKNYVDGFNRVRDKQDEDGRKELLKYVLGVRSDLPLDAGTNEFGVLSFNKKLLVSNTEQLKNLYDIYFKLETYKIARYSTLFEECENDLRVRYTNAVENKSTCANPTIKINWDLYNIRIDKFILISVAIFDTAFHLKLNLLKDNTENSMNELILALNERYSVLFQKMGFKSDTAKRTQIRNILSSLKNNEYSKFINDNTNDYQQAVTSYHEMSANDLLVKIKEISYRASNFDCGEHLRNIKLVNLLKSYYMVRFLKKGFLKCECCGEETFLTKNGEPYVEFHHLIPFNIANGPDHYLNLFALCPNCHKKFHFIRSEDKSQTYSFLNDNNYLQLTFVERLKKLKQQMILKSYHLEYLLTENAISNAEYENIAT